MSSLEAYNAVFAKIRDRFDIERQARKNAKKAGDLSYSIEGKDEKNEDYIYTQITDLFKNRQWLKGFELIEGKENISTKFYMRLLDFLFTYKINDDEDYEACETARVYFDLCLDKISQNPENVNYLMNIFEENKISDVVLSSIDQNDSGEECFSLAEYYFVIAKKILATKDFMAGEYVTKILSEWDKKLGKFYKFEKTNNPPNNNLQKKTEKLSDLQDELAYYQLAEDVNSEEEEKKYEKSMDEDNYRQRDLIERIEEINLSCDSDFSEQLRGSCEKGILLYLIKELKDNKPKIIDYLFDFLANDGNASLFLRQIGDIINQISPEYAVSKLLHLIKSKNEFLKRDATALLHRLEFGRIGISEEGVHYLEHVYDLGEYNNRAFHVSRLTPNGELGIFNQDLQLIKFIQLGDLGTTEKKTRAQVYDFVYETLFIGQKNETPEERAKRMQYLEEFKQNYYAKRAQLEKESGVTLNNLSFKEQGWFIVYFNKATPQAKEQIYKFVKDFGEEGIKTFLSLESDEQNGQIILDLSQQLDHNVAQAIFMKFAEVVRYINWTGAEISQQYIKNNKTVEPAAEIVKRAGQILVSKHKKMQEENYSAQLPEIKKKINKEFVKDLNNIKADTVIFSAMFKSIFETYGGVDFQEVVDLDLEHKNKKEFTTEDQEELKKFIAKVYTQKPVVRDYVIKKVNEDFLSSEAGHWYLLRRHGELIATMRFNKLGAKIARATSFIVDPELQTSAIGSAMEKNILDVESADKKILAVAEALGKPISHYVEKNNWLITGFYVDQDSGIPFFEIMRDNHDIIKYSSRNLFVEEILQLSKHPEQAENKGCLVLKTNSIPNDFDQEKIKTALEQDFVITRFLRGENFGSNAYLVFEKNKSLAIQKETVNSSAR